MTISAIKRDLHEYIDRADENKLKAMHSLIEHDTNKSRYSKEELAKFYGILQEYENGRIKTFPVDTIHREIRAKLHK
jgi:hypothetical protein